MTEAQQDYYNGYEKGFQEGRKSERTDCLKILTEEQEEFAEDRDKQALVYSIAAIKARTTK